MKTIKELYKCIDCTHEDGEKCIEYYDLISSAIEDVKELRKALKEWQTNKPNHCMSWEGDIILSKIDYIMRRYCLTEDDVK